MKGLEPSTFCMARTRREVTGADWSRQSGLDMRIHRRDECQEMQQPSEKPDYSPDSSPDCLPHHVNLGQREALQPELVECGDRDHVPRAIFPAAFGGGEISHADGSQSSAGGAANEHRRFSGRPSSPRRPAGRLPRPALFQAEQLFARFEVALRGHVAPAALVARAKLNRELRSSLGPAAGS
jgi:hypothetical protein